MNEEIPKLKHFPHVRTLFERQTAKEKCIKEVIRPMIKRLELEFKNVQISGKTENKYIIGTEKPTIADIALVALFSLVIFGRDTE